jgi:sugar phosphate isomerase/epimerase
MRCLGAKLLRFVIDDRDYHPTPEQVTALWPEIVPLLGEMTLGIENHDRFPARTLRQMVEAAGSDHVGVCLDTANSLGAGEGLEQIATTLAPVTVNLHVKDFHIERLPHLMGFTVAGRPAGHGMIDLPWLLKQLQPFAQCQTAILELWTPPEPVLADTIAKESLWAAQSLDYLKPFLNSTPRP